MELRRVRLNDPEVTPLLHGLRSEYERRYGQGDELGAVPAHEFELPDGAFLIVLEGGKTVAGGALRRLSSQTCEVKRMWTAPDQRRKGYASIVLDALETVAEELGYTTVRLETGWAQPEAHSLYRNRGYHQIPTYGSYERATAFECRLVDRVDKP
ncbi:MAG: GNAT family N-acetyltransferase [Acidimicrobiales bacterium]